VLPSHGHHGSRAEACAAASTTVEGHFCCGT
jgi:hypothetical protein